MPKPIVRALLFLLHHAFGTNVLAAWLFGIPSLLDFFPLRLSKSSKLIDS